jgi:two-component system chemotaxis response regulator CheB
LRVLVVDDAAAYRQAVSRALGKIPGVVVAGIAADLATARRKIEAGEIDAVTIDVNLAGESGLDLVRWLRERLPGVVPILVTSGETEGAKTAVDALLLGAAGIVLKPSGDFAADELQSALQRILQGVARPSLRPPTVLAVEPSRSQRELVAVGASTGGPPVLLTFLQSLPRDFEVPIVIVQHMPKEHVPYFAELLGQRSGRPVRVADDGELVRTGVTYVAGHGLHLRVSRRRDGLVLYQHDGPPEHNCRPAVDPLFRSVAEACGPTAVGVVMSGMGSDGALGAVELASRGAPVVVQDERSSVVWSMPGAVCAAGVASAVVPADQLGAWVVRRTSTSTSTAPPGATGQSTRERT